MELPQLSTDQPWPSWVPWCHTKGRQQIALEKFSVVIAVSEFEHLLTNPAARATMLELRTWILVKLRSARMVRATDENQGSSREKTSAVLTERWEGIPGHKGCAKSFVRIFALAWSEYSHNMNPIQEKKKTLPWRSIGLMIGSACAFRLRGLRGGLPRQNFIARIDGKKSPNEKVNEACWDVQAKVR